MILIPQPANPENPTAEVHIVSEFDKLHETLLTDDAEEGWASELHRYLNTMQRNVTKEMNLVEWWQVSCFSSGYRWNVHLLTYLRTMQLFPTLACIALDVLPAQASSVPCEWLFSGTKQIVVDHWASLGSIFFEEIVITKSAWRPDLYDMATWNASQVEEIDLFDFKELFLDDTAGLAWDKDMEGDAEGDEISGWWSWQYITFILTY